MEDNQKVKIAYVITRLERGGSPDVVLSLFQHLDEKRFDKYLIYGPTNNFPPCFDAIKQAYKDRIIFLPSLVRSINPVKDFIAFNFLLNFFKKQKMQIVHTHTSKAGFVARLAAKFARVPIIIHTPHGHVFYGYFNLVMNKLIILLERMLARITDKIITLTEAGKADHVRFKIADADKFVPIYCGINLEKFLHASVDKNLLKERLAIKEKFVVGTVSRLDPVKGVQYFIKAAKLISERIVDVKFVIVGDGKEKKRLIKLAHALGIKDKILFLGFSDNVEQILRVFDVFVLSSLNEGLGRAILEAMASGVAVVATNVGGVPSIINDQENGILVGSKDFKMIAGGVIHLLENEDLRKTIIKNALSGVKAKFKEEIMFEKTFNLYDELISQKL
jgi:glycosyltransferase involved in cell wall biosynthesis